MNVLFIANLGSPSASGLQRLWALERCGLKVKVVNKSEYKPKLGPWSSHVARVLKDPRLMYDVRKLESRIKNLAKSLNPQLIWFEWPREFSATFIEELRKTAPSAKFVSFQDDNPWGSRYADIWMWKNYFGIAKQFDLHLIKRVSDDFNLKKLGAVKTYMWKHGIYAPIFYPSDKPVHKQYPVSFIGTCMDDRAIFIEQLLISGIPVHVFGNRWHKRSNLPSRFPQFFHNEVEGEAYADVIRSSQICIGLVSHSNADEWTMRSYEVPGCATLLLAERTREHEQMFEHGKDVMLFSNVSECIGLLKQLLPNPEKCSAMGALAFENFIQRKRTIDFQMQNLLLELF